jgi:hypothetical protein
MDTVVEVAAVIVDLVVIPLTLLGVIVCFLKGHRAAAWTGTVVLALGVLAGIPLFREARERDAEGWMLVPWGIGLIVAIVIGFQARKPAAEGSRWASRRATALRPRT